MLTLHMSPLLTHMLHVPSEFISKAWFDDKNYWEFQDSNSRTLNWTWDLSKSRTLWTAQVVCLWNPTSDAPEISQADTWLSYAVGQSYLASLLPSFLQEAFIQRNFLHILYSSSTEFLLHANLLCFILSLGSLFTSHKLSEAPSLLNLSIFS